jgi:hypothetical protein
MYKEIFTQRTAIKIRHAAPMHEMVMAAIIPPSPIPSSGTTGEVEPAESTVVT